MVDLVVWDSFISICREPGYELCIAVQPAIKQDALYRVCLLLRALGRHARSQEKARLLRSARKALTDLTPLLSLCRKLIWVLVRDAAPSNLLHRWAFAHAPFAKNALSSPLLLGSAIAFSISPNQNRFTP